MTSPLSNIYQSLIARITDQVTYIKYIDFDYGQLETHERPEVAFPCLLIDFKNIRFEDISQLIQVAEGTLMLKLATDPYDATSSITPSTFQDAGLYFLELEQSLIQALHGWSLPIVYNNANPPVATQATKPMSRLSVVSDNRRPGLKVRELTFTLSFTDYSLKKTLTLTPATPSITDTLILPTS